MELPKLSDFVDYTICTLLFFGFLYIFVLDTTNKSKSFSTLQLLESPKLDQMTIYRDDLEEALAGASTKNKTVIITIVNKAYVEGDKPMLDLFLDGFWIGDGTRQLLNHLLIVAMDNTSYDRCKFLRLHCYKLQTNGVDFADEKIYMSGDFIKMMWRRTRFLGDVLKRGYNFIFTDTDVLWLRNPFTNLSLNGSGSTDLYISTDKFNGNTESNTNLINTGFYMIRSNNKTIQLFDAWYARKDNSSGLKEQDVLQKMIFEGTFRKLRLKVVFLNTIYFCGFCQDSENVRVVKTVHANCCRSIRAKLADLMAVIHDWKRYKTISANETIVSSFRWTRHVACRHSW